MRQLCRVFTDAKASAKRIREQKVARGGGEPYYTVSTHQTRFEKYEELVTQLFGPYDILRGTKRKPEHPSAKVTFST